MYMVTDPKGPRGPKEKKEQPGFPGKESSREREGGDDSLADSSPTDSRSDEKVIVNEQRGNKTVNAPSQTAANTSEGSSYDEEIIN
jgi:hypothetical protein